MLIHFIKPLKDKFKHQPEARTFLTGMQADILDNLDIFLEESEEQLGLAYASLEKKMPRRYQVNVLVGQGTQKFPIVVEESPSYHSLFGYGRTPHLEAQCSPTSRLSVLAACTRRMAACY